MTQNQESGASANDFGRDNAARVAKAIGAVLTEPKRSNAAILQGRRIVIKSAKIRTTSVGVPYTLLSKVDSVVAAFEEKGGDYVIFELSVDDYRKNEKPRSTDGAAGLVMKKVFLEKGREIGSLKKQK